MPVSLTRKVATAFFPEDKSQEKVKWETARDAYKAFFDEYGSTFSLYTEKTSDGKTDFYESYRKATSGGTLWC